MVGHGPGSQQSQQWRAERTLRAGSSPEPCNARGASLDPCQRGRENTGVPRSMPGAGAACRLRRALVPVPALSTYFIGDS